jgi:hypothetical protein
MSNEIVKWNGSTPGRKDPPKRESVAVTIARWRGGVAAVPSRPAPIAPYAPRHTETVITWAPPDNLPPLTSNLIELPRICARHKKLWTAVYRRAPGQSHHAYLRSNVGESWRLTTYATPDKWGAVPPDFSTGIELCPHCGAYTMDGSTGAVWCEGCRMWVCYGLTSPQGYFICQCGHEGQLAKDYLKKQGFR